MCWSAIGMGWDGMGCCKQDCLQQWFYFANHLDHLDKPAPGKEDSQENFILANDVDHLDQPVPWKENDSIQQYSLVCVRHELVVQGVASCKSCCSQSPSIWIIGWTDLLQRGQSRAKDHWLCLLLAKNIQYNNTCLSSSSICFFS